MTAFDTAQTAQSTPAAQNAPQSAAPAAPGVTFPPGDLYSDEPPLESSLHLAQIILLITCLDWLWQGRDDYFAAGNLTAYFSPRQLKSEDFRGPDFFVALGVEKRPRKSWVVWEEGGQYPNIIVELLSDSTAKTDRGLKKEIYGDIFRTPDYFWFDPDSLKFEGFHLVSGEYQPIAPDEQGRRWSHQLQLFLGVYDGKLRFFTPEGDLVPTPEEAAQAASEQLETERQRSETERQRAERLAAKLRELGIDPEA
ncbi:MAG: Uma2 family endonuclease [Elainellaceae cyanobacterium]